MTYRKHAETSESAVPGSCYLNGVEPRKRWDHQLWSVRNMLVPVREQFPDTGVSMDPDFARGGIKAFSIS